MNDALESRLRRHLSADGTPPAPTDRVAAAAGAIGRRTRLRRRIAGTVTAAAVAVAGVVGVFAVVLRDHQDRRVGELSVTVATTAPPTATTTAVPAAGWTPIPTDPRGPTGYPAVAWTGSEAVAVGGVDADGAARASAAAFDPATDAWRTLPDVPDGAGRVDAIAVWTGARVLVFGGTDQPNGGTPVASAWALDSSTSIWTPISAPPQGAITSLSPWVWTGAELLMWPSDGALGAIPAPLAYDPAGDAWRTLPVPPVAPRQHAAEVWTGREWVLWGGTTGTAELDDGAAFDPAAGTWRTIAAAPLAARRDLAVWTGTEMIVTAGSAGGDRATGNGELAFGDGAAYNPATDEWRRIADGPAHPGFLPVWTGSRLVMFAKGSAVLYDPALDRWTEDCCRGQWYQAEPVWTGRSVLLIGGSAAGDGGARFTVPDGG